MPLLFSKNLDIVSVDVATSLETRQQLGSIGFFLSPRRNARNSTCTHVPRIPSPPIIFFNVAIDTSS